MPSEWLGVHGGRSYGPSPRGKSLPGPAVYHTRYPTIIGGFYEAGLLHVQREEDETSLRNSSTQASLHSRIRPSRCGPSLSTSRSSVRSENTREKDVILQCERRVNDFWSRAKISVVRPTSTRSKEAKGMLRVDAWTHSPNLRHLMDPSAGLTQTKRG